jgi:hypothetical protein
MAFAMMSQKQIVCNVFDAVTNNDAAVQVLFNYGATYLANQCQPAGLTAILEDIIPSGFAPAGAQPPTLVRA